MSHEINDLASAFFAAIERGDLERVREIYSPDVAVWHNVTGRSQTREENLKLLEYFASRVPTRRYEVSSREFFPGGFVQRHVLHGELTTGETLAAPVCIVIHVEGGHIVRLYEYLDAAAVAAAFAS